MCRCRRGVMHQGMAIGQACDMVGRNVAVVGRVHCGSLLSALYESSGV